MPRFDSPALFSRVLDKNAGHWKIAPVLSAKISRRYLDESMVLETRFETSTGVLVLQDALATGENKTGHGLGRESHHALLRQIFCVRGTVEIEVEYVPRPEYGLIHCLLQKISVPAARFPGFRPKREGVLARGGSSLLVLSSDVALEIRGSEATSRFFLTDGETKCFAMTWGPSCDPVSPPWTSRMISRELENTLAAWRHWSHIHQKYEGEWKDLVHSSGRTLQALAYHPTGAICAAPTTSLPENAGGERNWDYRYCWVRDASFTMDALWIAACPLEAKSFFEFIACASLSQIRLGEDMQIMFGVGGEHDLTERTLPHLSGWRGSRPVRVGNAAWKQRQVDVYGELLAAAERVQEQLGEMDPVYWKFLAEVADRAANIWKEPDQGIWEFRGEPRHFVYSKVMCWVALDRALRISHLIYASTEQINHWTYVREQIRSEILLRGWSEKSEAFCQSFDSDVLDASCLMMPIVGFLEASDPRMIRTMDAIERHLSDRNGLIYRYLAEDGLPGSEGTFLICTFWLAQARAMAGQTQRAREIFERAIRYRSDLDLLAEEVDSFTGELLGNFPQAFSHIGLVNAAWAIDQAQRRADAA